MPAGPRFLKSLQVLLLLAAVVAVVAPRPSEAALDNVVTQWINATRTAVAGAGIQNQLSAKYYALVGLATHQALQKGGAPEEALAAFAGHTVLSASFPWNQSTYDALISKQLSEKYSTADLDKAQGVAVPLAAAMVKERTADESTRWSRFKPFPGGTQWRYQYVPGQKYGLYPQLANAKPFFTPAAKLEEILGNREPKNGPVFQPPRNDYTPTFELGEKGSTRRTQYQTDSAWFWAQGGNTSSIAGQWLEIARQVLPDNLSLRDTALFYARAGAAAYDASIAAWKVKYSTLAWRPVTAFRAGYPGFKAQPEWTQLLTGTPPHPEYPSGHQTTVGALLEVLLVTLGRKEKVSFSISSEGAPWLGSRSYDNLTSAAVEVGDSRLWGGLHFPSANLDGLKLGRLVAKEVIGRIGSGGGAAAAAAGGRRMNL